METILRVAVLEDDARYRQSLERLLARAPGFTLSGSFGSPIEALRLATEAGRRNEALPWDLVLMDLQMPEMNGIEATGRLKVLAPQLTIIVVTVFEEPATILRAICAGADGYLLKRTEPDELIAQLGSVASGGSPLTASVAHSVLDLLRRTGGFAAGPGGPSRLHLSEREQEVLRALSQGLGYKQVAGSLGLQLDTVRSHIRVIYRKLQVHSVSQAVGRAIREQLV